MQTALSEICGRRVREVVIGTTGTTIMLHDGWGIAIFNRFVWRRGADTPALSPRDLRGAVLSEAYIDGRKLLLVFEGAGTLIVDLRDDAYLGPEAAEIFGPNGEEIVVN
jgi:hypothetical protein